MFQRKSFCGLALAVCFYMLNGPLFAQSVWIDRSVDKAIWLEIQKPNFTDEYLGGGFLSEPLQTTFLTSNWYLSARWRVSGPLVLRAELPFINAGIKDQYYINPLGDTIQVDGGSENQFGNPLVGVELGGTGALISGEFAIRFPVVDDEHGFSSELGSFTDYDRFEAFVPDLWTLTAMANLQYKGPTGFLLRLRAGPALFITTQSFAEDELFADYSAQAGYQNDRLLLLGGITGRFIITEENIDFDQRFIPQLGVSGSYAFGRFIPGLHFRLPVEDDLNEILDFVFGLSVGYRLP